MLVEYIEIGSIVRLKSGGPDMTVNSIDEHKEMVECVWFTSESVYPPQWSNAQVANFGFDAITVVD